MKPKNVNCIELTKLKEFVPILSVVVVMLICATAAQAAKKPSCTAGQASFMLGQSVFHTGLSKVGLPGAKEGINTFDPASAVLLTGQGYAIGQFGKNYSGDRDEHLPTNHGFDEFNGNLYHLNAEEGLEPRVFEKRLESCLSI